MPVMRAGTRKLCIAYDAERYSGLGPQREFGIQAQLAGLLDFAFTTAGLALSDCHVQEQGDGGLALAPTGGGVDEPRVLVGLIRGFEDRLAEVNRGMPPQGRLRLRVALHQGMVSRGTHGFVGPSVTEACRLRDADAVRSESAAAPGSLVVAVADGLYRDVLAHGYHGLPGSAFRQITATSKKFHATAWIYPGSRDQVRPAPIPASEAGRRGGIIQENTATGHGLTIAALAGSVFADGTPRAPKEKRMPIEAEFAALAAAAAAAVATAIGTDAWQAVRDAVIKLFRKVPGNRHVEVAADLDRDEALVSGATDGARARRAVQQIWEARLAELLGAAHEPSTDFATELDRLIRLQEQPSAPVRQVNTAKDSGTVIAALLGDVYWHRDPPAVAAPPPQQEDGAPDNNNTR